MSNFLKIKSINNLFIIVLCLAVISCDPPNYIFENDASFSIEKPWTINDSIVYSFEIKDTNRFYNLLMEIDHHKKYAFENLYVKIKTRFPNQKQTTDIVNITLADETGDWYSDCRGKTCTFYLALQEEAIFAEKGKYQITVHPWMRQDTIKEMYRLGFKVERLGKRN